MEKIENNRIPVRFFVVTFVWTWVFMLGTIGIVIVIKRANKRRTITAKTAPEQNASTEIFDNNNFVFTEIVQDEEIGDA